MIDLYAKYIKSQDNKLVFCLILDPKKKTERIIIGQFNQVFKCINNIPSTVIFNKTRKLGTLFFELNSENLKEWNEHAISNLFFNLTESDNKTIKEREESAYTFLNKKIDTQSPINIYIANRIKDDYLEIREKFCTSEEDKELISYRYCHDIQILSMFFATTFYYNEKANTLTISKLGFNQSDLDTIFSKQKIELLFIGEKNISECAIAYSSIIPLFHYYKHKLDEWHLNLKHCKVCGDLFSSNTLKQTICSNKCKKEQNKITKKRFDDNAKENGYDNLHRKYCQTWLNQLNKAKLSGDFSPSETDHIELLYKDFKINALKEKKALKKRLSCIDSQNMSSIEKEINNYEKYLHKQTLVIHSIISEKISKISKN